MPKPSLYERLDAAPSKQARLEIVRQEGFPVSARATALELKAYRSAELTSPLYFVHSTTATPAQIVEAGGLDPDFASEVCVLSRPVPLQGPPDPNFAVQMIGNRGGRLLLVCQTPEPVEIARVASDPAGSRRFDVRIIKAIDKAGFLSPDDPQNTAQGYAYVARIPASAAAPWRYFSSAETPDRLEQQIRDGGTIRTGEIGFDQKIPLAYLTAYTGHQRGQRADGTPQSSFIEVPFPWKPGRSSAGPRTQEGMTSPRPADPVANKP